MALVRATHCAPSTGFGTARDGFKRPRVPHGTGWMPTFTASSERGGALPDCGMCRCNLRCSRKYSRKYSRQLKVDGQKSLIINSVPRYAFVQVQRRPATVLRCTTFCVPCLLRAVCSIGSTLPLARAHGTAQHRWQVRQPKALPTTHRCSKQSAKVSASTVSKKRNEQRSASMKCN